MVLTVQFFLMNQPLEMYSILYDKTYFLCILFAHFLDLMI